MYFLDLSCIQMARLRNSVAFKAVSTLDFQRDMFGSINKLLCDKEPDFNSTRMHVSSRSKQMANNKAIFIMGNSSGKCCSKVLYQANLTHSTCVIIIYLHFCFTVVFVVMVARKWTKQTNNITGHGNWFLVQPEFWSLTIWQGRRKDWELTCLIMTNQKQHHIRDMVFSQFYEKENLKGILGDRVHVYQ